MGEGDDLKSALDRIEALLEKLPKGAGKRVREAVRDLRSLLVDQRPPRLVLVGRRGAGKSSLVNAMLGTRVLATGHVASQTGAARWQLVPEENPAFEILDTRGLQEGSRPSEADAARDSIVSIVAALRDKKPDACLFVVKAKEVDAAIDGDVAGLETILREAHKLAGAGLPLVAVVSQCDELEPKNTPLHDASRADPDELAEKTGHVEEAVRRLRAKLLPLETRGEQVLAVLGVSSYLSFRADGSMRADERWNIDELIRFLGLEMPKDAVFRLARATRVRKVQKKVASDLVDAVALACASIAATPIPIADIVPITALQVALVGGVGYVAGRDLDKQAIAEFFAAMGLNVGAALVFREAVRAMAKLVPLAGEGASAAVAWSGTKAVGAASIAYFLEGATAREARAAMKRASSEAGDPPDSDD